MTIPGFSACGARAAAASAPMLCLLLVTLSGVSCRLDEHAVRPPVIGPGELPSGRGALLPWERYEAEDGTTNGTVLGPGRQVGTLEGEAAGRRAVRLTAGRYIEWTVRKEANAVVIRVSIPDSAAGGGQEKTLSLYVNGVHRKDLAVSSRRSWLYGPEGTQTDNPSDGTPRRIYDESRALIGTVPAGAVVRLSVDASDTAAWYGIDFLELEAVRPPREMPEGYLSVKDYGAAGDGVTDDTAALQAALDAAGSGGGIWLPEGTYRTSGRIHVNGRIVHGAGMWHTTFVCSPGLDNTGDGRFGFDMTGDGSQFYDFAAFSNGTVRGNGGKFWSGNARSGTRIGRVWVEHVECAYWVAGGDDLRIFDSRFRNTYADAVNLCNGTAGSLISNCTARTTGDDAFAIWSADDPGIPSGPSRDNTISHCTVENVWRAAAYAVYGGHGNVVEDCVALDTLVYPGITISADFAPFFSFSGTTTFRNIDLIRCGGAYWGGQQFGAVWIHAARGSVLGVRIESLTIVSPTYSGLHFQSANGYAMEAVLVSGVAIADAGTNGILVKPSALGSAAFTGVSVSGSGGAAFSNLSPSGFTVTRGTGNTGW